MIRFLKKLINALIEAIVLLLSKIIRLNCVRLFKHYKNIFYIKIAKQEFRNTGKNFYIEYPYHIVGAQNITIGNNFSAFSGLRLEAIDKYSGYTYTPEIFIGDNVSINNNCHIGCINKIVIGNNVLIASTVFITDHFHGTITRQSIKLPPLQRMLTSKGPVVIEDNVWIGEGVVIMPGVNIGHHAVIGANAVVVKNVPPYAVAGGVPAKILKRL